VGRVLDRAEDYRIRRHSLVLLLNCRREVCLDRKDSQELSTRHQDKGHRSHSGLDRVCDSGPNRCSSWGLRRSCEECCQENENLN